MSDITAAFWDVGGVLLNNGWDEPARRNAVRRFSLGWDDFESRHNLVVPRFEDGQFTLNEYLEHTVFYQPRLFSRDEFRDFMFDQSRPNPETLALAAHMARSGKYLMATLNNESLELNLHRIQKFGLRTCFSVFFSSCFLGVAKPNPGIYRMALHLTQRAPDECLLIDDRTANLETARDLGMRTIHYQDSARLREELRHNGVLWETCDKEKR